MRRPGSVLICAILSGSLSLGLGAQGTPWLRDSLAQRYPDGFPLSPFHVFDSAAQVKSRAQLHPGAATVEIVGSAPALEDFLSFRLELALDLRKAFLKPPASFHSLELSDFMSTDPSNPQWGDLKRAVRALGAPALPPHMAPP